MAYVIRDTATHEVLYVNTLGQTIFFAHDTSHEDKPLGVICTWSSIDVAQQIRYHLADDFRTSNIAAGRSLHIWPAYLA